mmetsp:Transcript_8724/g.23719  ORF Transcript_8724/g.23719 Transcript_8724/m.23719 type:complete len:791 (-) Transcript_8724:603-2975(-)
MGAEDAHTPPRETSRPDEAPGGRRRMSRRDGAAGAGSSPPRSPSRDRSGSVDKGEKVTKSWLRNCMLFETPPVAGTVGHDVAPELEAQALQRETCESTLSPENLLPDSFLTEPPSLKREPEGFQGDLKRQAVTCSKDDNMNEHLKLQTRVSKTTDKMMNMTWQMSEDLSKWSVDLLVNQSNIDDQLKEQLHLTKTLQTTMTQDIEEVQKGLTSRLNEHAAEHKDQCRRCEELLTSLVLAYSAKSVSSGSVELEFSDPRDQLPTRGKLYEQVLASHTNLELSVEATHTEIVKMRKQMESVVRVLRGVAHPVLGNKFTVDLDKPSKPPRGSEERRSGSHSRSRRERGRSSVEFDEARKSDSVFLSMLSDRTAKMQAAITRGASVSGDDLTSSRGASKRGPSGESRRAQASYRLDSGTGTLDVDEIRPSQAGPSPSTSTASNSRPAKRTTQRTTAAKNNTLYTGEESDRSNFIRNIAFSRRFNFICIFLAFGNAVVCGMQANSEVTTAFEMVDSVDGTQGESLRIFWWLQVGFLGWLCFELLINVAAMRWWFLFGRSWKWNVFDIVVFVSSGLELLVTRGGVLSAWKVLRILRFGKIMQAFRFLRFFHGLQKMVISLAVLMELRSLYGSFGKCLLTLFRSVSSGGDWSAFAAPIAKAGAVYAAIWVAYIGCMLFGVLNILTGIFVESSIEAAGSDCSIAVQEQLDKEDELEGVLSAVFTAMDSDNSNELTREEFERLLENGTILAHLGSLGIEPRRAKDLFELLDEDHSGFLELHEVVEGLMQMQGDAKAVEV